MTGSLSLTTIRAVMRIGAPMLALPPSTSAWACAALYSGWSHLPRDLTATPAAPQLPPQRRLRDAVQPREEPDGDAQVPAHVCVSRPLQRQAHREVEMRVRRLSYGMLLPVHGVCLSVCFFCRCNYARSADAVGFVPARRAAISMEMVAVSFLLRGAAWFPLV